MNEKNNSKGGDSYCLPSTKRLVKLLLQLSGSDDALPETAPWDAVVIGGGPAGLTAACRLSFQGLKVAWWSPKTALVRPQV